MITSAAQLQFAAEFVLFVVVLAGAALGGLRAELLAGRALSRAAFATGFVLLGGSAFLHGALVYDHPDDPVIVGLRGAGVVALALGSVGWRAGRGARWLFHGGLAALA
ncbi:MAG: hypothetical protein ACRD0M_09260, partial [Acidimicrobiales bacterium]